MQLSIEEAATRLGKSCRQIRYLIQEHRLPAKKVAGRWVIELAELPLEPEHQKAQQRKQERLRSAVEAALELPPSPAGGRRYSLGDLKAFQLGRPLYQDAHDRLGADHAATQALRRALEHLARGCHRFEGSEKAAEYSAARDEASLAVCALLIAPPAQTEALVLGIEQELMAALAGLLRRLDRAAAGRGRQEGRQR